MHPTTTTAPRVRSRWVFLALFGTLIWLALALAAPAPAAQKNPFDGGPIAAFTPTSVANDHTVSAVRLEATAGGSDPLAADTTYYVKFRFTPNSDGSPAGVDNRGFTWNGTTGTWAQEREDWTLFPTVTTDATGAIAQSDWFYCKFGDTTKTGTFNLIVSLSTGTSGNTRNGSSFVAVTVLDMTIDGAWVHPGISNEANAGRTAKVVDHAAPGTLIALQRIEANFCDDDADGVLDNEQYGPVQAGSFDMAVPTGRMLQAQAGGTKPVDWPDSTGFTIATPDTDVAFGTADQAPPTAPGAVTIRATDAGAALTWGVATDDTAVTEYRVYRWTDAPAGAGYTPISEKVATVTSGASYTDSGLTNGMTYHYLVRAADAATNVGPRSLSGSVTPMAAAQLALQTSASRVNWGGKATLTGQLTDGADPFMAGQQVRLEWSYDGSTWTLLQMLDPTALFAYSVAVGPTQNTQYRLVFEGDATHATAASTPVSVKPRAKLGSPVAGKTVKKSKAFSVYGTLVPKHSSGTKTVKIKCYEKRSGKWKLRKTFTAVNRNYKSYSRYKAKISLPSRGQWKLVARYGETAKYASRTSSARYVRVN